MHILPDTSRSKRNQTIKYGQLIVYNTRNIFLEKHTQKLLGKRVPDPCMKNQNSILFDQQSEMLYSLFLLYIQV